MHEPSGPDLPYTRHSICEGDVEQVVEALNSGRIAQGTRVESFERALATEAGARHAAAVSSGTTALELALAALEVGPGDEVVVPPITFVATANAVLRCGARPRFADVDPVTLTLDPGSVARCLGPRTRGAIAVHYAGHPADTWALQGALGTQRFLLEDASHALGASLHGRAAGSLGTAACFSFHPAKAITTGEGGAVTTDSPALAARVARLRDHGLERRGENFTGLGLPPDLENESRAPWVYELHELGSNARLSEPSAALGLSQLQRLRSGNERRRKIVEAYNLAFSDLEALETPRELPDVQSAWHLYAVRLRTEQLRGGRAALFAALRARGLGVQVHYVPVHLQPYYRSLLGTGWGDLPVAEAAYLRLISLPLFPGLRDEDVGRVVDIVRDELRRLRR